MNELRLRIDVLRKLTYTPAAMSTSARARRYGKAPPILPGIETGADMARAAFRLGRARTRAKRSVQQAPEAPTFERFEQDARRRGSY